MLNLDYHIVSHIVYTGKEVIKNGFITFNSSFEIQKIESKKLSGVESARTQFYSGMILPAIYSPKTKIISLKEFGVKDLHPDEHAAIDASNIRTAELIAIIRELQIKHNLIGIKFLEFWNKISLNIAEKEGVNFTIEPKNILPLLNLQGLSFVDFIFSDQTKIRTVKL